MTIPSLSKPKKFSKCKRRKTKKEQDAYSGKCRVDAIAEILRRKSNEYPDR